ncbi:MAG: hypothetical protein K9K37_04490 [Desulfocapsa sp.]|nr:hypothetical protein [Desulfocapsa sp.]
MEYKEIIRSCYHGDGPQKLGKAVLFYREYGEELLQHPDITSQLKSVKASVTALENHMAAMGMEKVCTRCAATPNGGCCSAYMGHENTDVLQLLANILAGVEVRVVKNDGVECCFLEKNGCIFLLKPIFCVSYLCGQIQKESDDAAMEILGRKTGDLLGVQGELEQRLIRYFQMEP